MDRSPWMDVDWSAHQRWVEVAGRPVNVIELGSGPPILFVHGHSGAWQNWLEQLPGLAGRHRVIAVDLPGFGSSPMPIEPVSMSLYARICDGLLDAMGVGAATVVGNSMGGFVGAEMAIQMPARVERLALVSAAGVAKSYMGSPTWFMSRYSERVLRLLSPLLIAPDKRVRRMVRRPRMRSASLKMVAAHPEELSPAIIWEMLVRSGRKPAAPAAAAAIADYDFRDRLPDIACPTLIVWGANDRVVPPSSADEFERLIGDTRKVVFEDTGHVPMIERPERFNRLLDDFLAERPNEDVDETSEAASEAAA
ncbi:MAG TPA: alpha/beta hydrolase [Solirubrobacteraceae bacterium]